MIGFLKVFLLYLMVLKGTARRNNYIKRYLQGPPNTHILR